MERKEILEILIGLPDEQVMEWARKGRPEISEVAIEVLNRRNAGGVSERSGIEALIEAPIPQARPSRAGDSYGLNQGFVAPAAEGIANSPPFIPNPQRAPVDPRTSVPAGTLPAAPPPRSTGDRRRSSRTGTTGTGETPQWWQDLWAPGGQSSNPRRRGGMGGGAPIAIPGAEIVEQLAGTDRPVQGPPAPIQNAPVPEERPVQTAETQANDIDPNLPQIMSLEQRLAQLRGIMPPQVPQQQYPMINEAQERDRMRLMAQLAIAGGIVSGAGPGWEQAGRGFQQAAGIYGEGFERYQRAMERQSDVDFNNRSRQFEYDTRLRELAVNESGRAADDARKSRDEVFKRRLDIIKATTNKDSDDPFGPLAAAEGQGEMSEQQKARMSMFRLANELYGDDIPTGI